MNELWLSYLSLVDSRSVKILIVLILIYLLLSVIVSIHERRFLLSNLTNMLDKALIPLYGGLVVIGLIVMVQPGWSSHIPSMWGYLDLMVLGLIAIKAMALGLTIPLNIPFLRQK